MTFDLGDDLCVDRLRSAGGDSDDDEFFRTRNQLMSLRDDLLARSRAGQLYVNVSGLQVAVDADRTTTSSTIVCPSGSEPDADRQVCGTWFAFE